MWQRVVVVERYSCNVVGLELNSYLKKTYFLGFYFYIFIYKSSFPVYTGGTKAERLLSHFHSTAYSDPHLPTALSLTHGWQMMQTRPMCPWRSMPSPHGARASQLVKHKRHMQAGVLCYWPEVIPVACGELLIS